MSRWIAETKGGTNTPFRIIPSKIQREAFKAMGFEALPALLKSVRPKQYDPWWLATYRRSYASLPVVITRHLPTPAPYFPGTEMAFQSYVAVRCRDLRPQSEPVLIKFLGHSRPEVRATAAWALGCPDHGSPEAFSALTNHLRDDDSEVRKCVVAAISCFGAAASNAVPAIMEIIRRSPPPNRYANSDNECATAFQALGTIGPGALAAVPLLQESAGQRTNSYLRVLSAVALWHVRRQPSDALPVLMEELESSDMWTKHMALDCLGEMGSGAAPAVATIVTYLDSLPIFHASDVIPEWHQVLWTLRKIDPDAAEKWQRKASKSKP